MSSTRYLDRETDLYFYGEWYYSPELGRWTIRDPLDYPRKIDDYCTFRNSPISLIDAFGLEPVLVEKVYWEEWCCDILCWFVANGIFRVVIPIPLPLDVAPYVCPMSPTGNSGFEEVWEDIPCPVYDGKTGPHERWSHREFYDEEERVCYHKDVYWSYNYSSKKCCNE